MREKIFYVAILCIVLLSACTKDIQEITESPEKYLHNELELEGRVTFVLDVPFMQSDFFKINDKTGEIWIYTEKGAPPSDEEVNVKGKLIRLSEVPYINKVLGWFKIDAGYCLELKEIDY